MLAHNYGAGEFRSFHLSKIHFFGFRFGRVKQNHLKPASSSFKIGRHAIDRT